MRHGTIALSALALGLAARAVAQAPAPAPDDPYIWLEDKDGARSMQWVEAENAASLPRLEKDPRYAGFYKDAYTIAAATDRIPMPELTYGRVLNFWRDDAHPHGLWRWTTPESYRTADPHWTTLLDLDALGKAEGKTWVWKGESCLEPEERICTVALSDGGEDAVTLREFDLQTGAFVPGGFTLPTSKQDAAWIDKDTILVARDWGAGTMTTSGYPFVVKELKRGQPLSAAKEVFRGAAGDQVESFPQVLTDGQGHRVVLLTRGTTFFGHETYALTPKGAVKLPIPEKSNILGMVDGQVVIQLSEDWTAGGKTIPGGGLVGVDYRQLTGGAITPGVIFQPNARQSVNGALTTKSRVVASILDNVRGRGMVFSHGPGGWASSAMALPDNAAIDMVSSSSRGDDAYFSVTGFLTPTTLWSVDAATAKVAQVKAMPARFDGSKDVVEQFEATSTDGTKIPYFIVHRKGIPLDGSTPTIMTAYGGFEVSSTPYYSGSMGKLWLENGGSFVLANIRGGGEFGPAWHEAGRKTKRQIIYDDFASVAKDVFARKLSSSQKFGIIGGSNGGLLMGVEFNQHPDLWKAVVIEVPLLDMMRYEKIQAGASWVDEYGSVSVPAEKAFLQTISPYQNLKKGVAYPEPFIVTTTKDDRVGPQHARKFAARMKEYGLPYLYYEDTAGGHSADADIAQGARLSALNYTYFSQKLIGPAVTGAK
ncbi:S9 family peptidase [Sphingomonas sp. CGMCC 1.13654]|uniref:S9 family peptidase n=1 Tax=Sphingomonas chungangi TaxID=2683589 RepID=A0A838LBU2_9SPHN|nr:prolyl oligopeptidase family serine peptidase [Sphingomonas chungangi]MBA2935606.1 S9 family peptidase [Sphingomonas chungangi]MVW54297.1 prolyl oligopeptidase family serine peptidase [Sphingomonas chungangi]